MNTPDLNSLREQVKSIDEKPYKRQLIPNNITLNNKGAVLLLLMNVGLTMYVFYLKKKYAEGKVE